MNKNRVHYMQGRQRLALAQRLDATADQLAGDPGGEPGPFQEDAVAVLRWSAAYLRRDTVRDEDLAGLLIVF